MIFRWQSWGTFCLSCHEGCSLSLDPSFFSFFSLLLFFLLFFYLIHFFFWSMVMVRPFPLFLYTLFFFFRLIPSVLSSFYYSLISFVTFSLSSLLLSHLVFSCQYLLLTTLTLFLFFCGLLSFCVQYTYTFSILA